MATLEGRSPSETFQFLLNVDNPNGIDGTVRPVQDGEGTEGPFSISTGIFRLNAGITMDGAASASFDFENIAVLNLPTWELIGTNSPTSGSSFQITGIPPSATMLKVVFTDMDFSEGTRIRMKVMDNSVVQDVGYRCSSFFYDDSSTVNTSSTDSQLDMIRINTDGVNQLQSGVGYLCRNDATGDWVWVCFGRKNDTAIAFYFAMAVAIGKTPNIVTSMNGVEFSALNGTFAAGTVSVYSSGE